MPFARGLKRRRRPRNSDPPNGCAPRDTRRDAITAARPFTAVLNAFRFVYFAFFFFFAGGLFVCFVGAPVCLSVYLFVFISVFILCGCSCLFVRLYLFYVSVVVCLFVYVYLFVCICFMWM